MLVVTLGPAGPKPHILLKFDSQTVDYICRQIYDNSFLEANTPIGFILGSQYVRASGAYRETMKNIRIFFACPLNS